MGSTRRASSRRALKIDQKDWSYLRDQLLAGVQDAPVVAETEDRYGIRYEVTIDVVGLNGRTLPVTTSWLIACGGEIPRLITVYVAS